MVEISTKLQARFFVCFSFYTLVEVPVVYDDLAARISKPQVCMAW